MIGRIIILVLVGVILLPTVASARRGVKGSPQKKQARAAYKEGKAHFHRQDYPAAIEAFKRSHALYPHRNTLFNIALSLAHKGAHKDAFRFLWRYLKRASSSDPPLDEILKRIRRQYGVLHVIAHDRKAEIYIDGRRVGQGKSHRILPAGRHALELRQGDRVVARKMLELVGGRIGRWELGVLRVAAERPQDAIFLDGRPVGRGRMTRILSAGPHVVEVRRDHRVVARRQVRMGAGKVVGWTAKAKPTVVPSRTVRIARGGLHWAWFATFMAVTLGAAAGAAYTSFETREIWDEFKVDRTNHSLADRGHRMQLAANSLWGVTAALAAGVVIVSIFTRWSKYTEQAGVTLVPIFGPSGAGATMTWRFP